MSTNYSSEFKQNAVKLAVESDQSVAQTARVNEQKDIFHNRSHREKFLSYLDDSMGRNKRGIGYSGKSNIRGYHLNIVKNMISYL